MLDKKLCDREFPYRWRSSLAIFSYQPPDEHQTYEGSVISYLKVACTITGYQADPEVGIQAPHLGWNDPVVIDNYKSIVSQYYGCYGAILEVAIASPGGEGGPEGEPYFIDFEPKKREVYEIVTESGESMSRTLEDIGVRKGTTTSQSHEYLDILSGASAGAFTVQGQGSGQWGTKDIGNQEYTNVRNTDEARELRETLSHTTQLTQMYHQFTSYHLGTNRAVFFMVPRPHVVQSDLTFVNGPRELEGIQEVFLVVLRPARLKNFCVEAYLETAHIASTPIETHEPNTAPLELNIPAQSYPPADQDQFFLFHEDSEVYDAPDGWEIDLSRNGGYEINSVTKGEAAGPADYKVTAAIDRVTAWGRVQSAVIDDVQLPGWLDLKLTVFLLKKELTTIGYEQSLWLTGRGLCCCPPGRVRARRPRFEGESVVFEGRLPGRRRTAIGRTARLTVEQANEVRAEVERTMYESVNHPDRYPFGLLQFPETQFVSRAVARVLDRADHPDNQRLNKIKGTDREAVAKISAVAPEISRRRLLDMPLQQQVSRFSLTLEEATKLRRVLLGIDRPRSQRRAR
jgi:hypothetical protein